MNNKEHIDKMTAAALERSGSFITRPVFVIAGLCLVLGINALVIAYNNNNTDSDSFVVNEQTVASDEFGTTVATLYDIENNEP